MTLGLRYAVRSDVGLLREGNEDSAYAGPRLLAVADGMGGHAAGEVASSVAIAALSELDNEVPAGELEGALRAAVARANQILHDMVAADPSIGGMGTTLTALLWAGNRVALCHIGDSRAYVLSRGEFFQLTHDHTLVQSLVDDGRISPDEAATHPQRSLLLRALDGSSDAKPDVSVHEARVGDRYLLCSDGLSSVVSEETLHQSLASIAEPDDAVLHLIELAIKGGGPDNITCIVADVVDSTTTARPPTSTSVLAGAASNGSGQPLLRTDSPAGRAHVLTQTAPQAAIMVARDAAQPAAAPDHEGELPARRRWPIVTSVLALLMLVIVGAGYAGWHYSQGQFYVGADSGDVAIFQGINQNVAGLHLSHIYQRTDIPLAALPTTYQQSIRQTITSSGKLADAQRVLGNIRSTYHRCQVYYAAQKSYQRKLQDYRKALDAYKKKYGTSKPKRVRGKLVKPPVPPKPPSAPQEQCPPEQVAAGGGSGSPS